MAFDTWNFNLMGGAQYYCIEDVTSFTGPGTDDDVHMHSWVLGGDIGCHVFLGEDLPLFGCYCAGEIGPADQAEVAPGVRGMVMLVFTLPSFQFVFKLIKDRFDPGLEHPKAKRSIKRKLGVSTSSV